MTSASLGITDAHQLILEAQELARLGNMELNAALFAILIDRIGKVTTTVELVQEAVLATLPITPEEVQQADDWLVHPIQVETAGTPKQGPNVPVLNGTDIVVRQRRHSTDRTGFVSRNQGELTNALARVELGNNDAVTLKASNLEKLHFDADTDNTFFEIIIDRKVAI